MGPIPGQMQISNFPLTKGILTVKNCTLSSEPVSLDLLGKIALLEPGKMIPLKNPLIQLSLSSSPLALENLSPYISALKDQGLKGILTLKGRHKWQQRGPQSPGNPGRPAH